jgi:class 3 adenylate cyclase
MENSRQDSQSRAKRKLVTAMFADLSGFAALSEPLDPERAPFAAFAMEEALGNFNLDQGTDLGLHFGINTGLVVAGGVGVANRTEYTVMGDAVNLASRLEAIHWMDESSSSPYLSSV